MTHDEIEWTDEEREALDRLPREIDPGRILEERTVAALRERGLLGRSRPGAPPTDAVGPDGPRRGGTVSRTSTPRRFAGSFHPAWWAAGIAAALAIFFAGLATGQGRAGVTTDDLMTALRSAEAAERPSLIQHTGSLYVDAIAGLATATADREAVGTGVEVGLTALYAAAYELARLHPEDPRLQQVLDVLGQQPQTDGDPETDVHWF
ncbi:MAG: hypothetical protein ACN0LA_05940 [Candidatus Longimicrobiales bacterium M2_2A_002]